MEPRTLFARLAADVIDDLTTKGVTGIRLTPDEAHDARRVARNLRAQYPESGPGESDIGTPPSFDVS